MRATQAVVVRGSTGSAPEDADDEPQSCLFPMPEPGSATVAATYLFCYVLFLYVPPFPNHTHICATATAAALSFSRPRSSVPCRIV